MLQAHYLLNNTASRLLCKEVHYSNMFLWSIQTALLLIAALSAMAAPPPLLSLKPPAPGSPIAGILDHLTVLKPGSGSGNGVHYQLISCRQSAAAIAAASPAIQNALKALVSSLDEVVDSMAASVNLTSSVLQTALHQGLVFQNINFTDIHSPQQCASEQDLDDYQCKASQLIPEMKCYGRLLGDMLVQATNDQMDRKEANKTKRSELYRAYAFVNFTVDLERMVNYTQCSTVQPSCVTATKICPSYAELNVSKSEGYFPRENLSDLKELGLLMRIKNGYNHLLVLLKEFSACSTQRSS